MIKGGLPPNGESLALAVTVQVRAPAEEMIFAMGGYRESPSFAEDHRGRQRQWLGDILVSPDGNGEDWLTLVAQAPFGARDSFWRSGAPWQNVCDRWLGMKG